ncbi:MAG: hypothetical protein ALECFALPRED_003507 [Alectoria fallacina]|uniref:GDP-mannose transporter n=1 Tax=Alectoria fallacina TaxID=1903189 RepID=A0A8H3FPJ5_9LECA|nr:MAG: hypothetical protein ALECFALPRED_003507 [Alectoria fallacina]
MDALNDGKVRLVSSNTREEALRPRSESGVSDRTLLNMSDSETDEKRRSGDLEKDGLVEQLPKVVTKEHATKDPYARAKILMWMFVNTLATVTIVFCNKAIFSDKSFSQCQAAFAAFHFFVTAATLYLLSRPSVAMFEPRKIPIMNMLPLAVAMAMNIVGMNVSLQVSTITFYQITRVLLTPIVAIINFFFYKKTIPKMAVYALIPMCFGVGLISYYDQKKTPDPGAPIKAVGALSVLLAIGSVTVSGIYTIWIGTYQRKYEANGFQLLYNQAPLGGVLLLYVVPWTDKFPALDQTPAVMWGMILLSGFLAALINLSQFFIIGGSGPLESTVVGHLKTCLIVVIGAFSGGKVITDKAAFGILLALISIFSYSAIMMRHTNLANAVKK